MPTSTSEKPEDGSSDRSAASSGGTTATMPVNLAHAHGGLEDMPSDLESINSASLENGSQEMSNQGKEQRGVRGRAKVALRFGRKPSSARRWSEKLSPIIKPLDSYRDGYGKLAAYQKSDSNFLIFRKHEWLRNRVLAQYQDRLAELEDDLLRLDEAYYAFDPQLLMSRRKTETPDNRREELFEKIERTLEKYDELLLRTQQIKNIKRPTRRDQQSVANFIHNRRPQVNTEAEWIKHSHDLAALSTDQEYGWLNGLIEDTFRRLSESLTLKLFRTKNQRALSGTEDILLVSGKRFNRIIAVCTTALATALLLVPVALLAEVVVSGINQIFIIFGFTLAFALACAVFTKARRQDILAASAAYCAVLVVFLGNANNNSDAHIMFVLENGTVVNATRQANLLGR